MLTLSSTSSPTTNDETLWKTVPTKKPSGGYASVAAVAPNEETVAKIKEQKALAKTNDDLKKALAKRAKAASKPVAANWKKDMCAGPKPCVDCKYGDKCTRSHSSDSGPGDCPRAKTGTCDFIHGYDELHKYILQLWNTIKTTADASEHDSACKDLKQLCFPAVSHNPNVSNKELNLKRQRIVRELFAASEDRGLYNAAINVLIGGEYLLPAAEAMRL
jgi:hypothetical protein